MPGHSSPALQDILKTRKSRFMFRHVTMDDRARMPWRFYGAARAVLARA